MCSPRDRTGRMRRRWPVRRRWSGTARPRRYWRRARCGGSRLLLQLSARSRRDIVKCGMLAELECADVRDDRPAVWHWDLIGVTRHRTNAICYDVEEVADGRLLQAWQMK